MKVTPELSKDAAYLRGPRTQNLLRWDLTVEPSANGEKAMNITYEFKMELDRNMTISDLQSAGAFEKAAAAQLDLTPVSAEDQARINAAIAKLSPADQALARAQVFCAIDQDSRDRKSTRLN